MATENDFKAVFERLRQLLQDNTPGAYVGKNAAANFVLYIKETDNPKPWEWFGGVSIGKNYVSYHLMSVYATPTQREEMSEALKKRMQGKACFNFKTVDETLFAELAELTRIGWENYPKTIEPFVKR